MGRWLWRSTLRPFRPFPTFPTFPRFKRFQRFQRFPKFPEVPQKFPRFPKASPKFPKFQQFRPIPYNLTLRAVLGFVEDTTNPYLNVFRAFIPRLGMFDISPMSPDSESDTAMSGRPSPLKSAIDNHCGLPPIGIPVTGMPTSGFEAPLPLLM